MGCNYIFIAELQLLRRWRLAMDNQFHSSLYNRYNYLSKLEFKLVRVVKGATGVQWPIHDQSQHLFIVTMIALIAIGVDPNWSRASASQTMVLTLFLGPF